VNAIGKSHDHSRTKGCGPTCACSPTPLRGPKIVAISARGFGSKAFPVYRGGAADAQDVRRLSHRWSTDSSVSIMSTFIPEQEVHHL